MVQVMPPERIVPPQWIVPQWEAPLRVRALSTTRHGGVSRGKYAGFNVGVAVGDDPAQVAANRAQLRALLPGEPFWLKQVHGTRVAEAGSTQADAEPVEADASVTRSPGTVLVIQAADCMPVLLAARSGDVIAAAHAGWRGLAAGVIENVVAAMGVAPGEIAAWLGPAIGGASYEVGQDVHDAFASHDPAAALAFTARGGSKYFVDLYALARQRLAGLGVTSVHGGNWCTHGDAERFYSYRRDGVTGRMATLIWLER